MAFFRGALVKVVREPLVHFLIIGAAIFGLYGLAHDAAEDDATDQIIVSSGDIERLSGLWQKQRQRPPTARELRGLIEEHVREEVLYREALALGLDRDDTIVRRRLAQKFEFLAEDVAAARDPSSEELTDFLDANRIRYEIPPRLTFTQVYFSPDRRGAAAESDALLTLASLRSGSTDSVSAELGDRIMLDARYLQQTPAQIEATFGRAFADALTTLESGIWSGPIESGYGLHLVRIDERTAARAPALAEVEAQIRGDWLAQQRQQANDAIYQRLLSRYRVVIEEPPRAIEGAGS